MAGVELNDRLIAWADAGVAQGAAPVPRGVRGADALGAELARVLAGLPAGEPTGWWLATAPPEDPGALGVWLHQLRAAGHAVLGFADRAALLAAWLKSAAPLVVVDLSRHRIDVSVAATDATAAGLRRQVTLPGGEAALQDAWLELAAATLVQQTRFDPLHDQSHESRLRALLPGLAAQAQRAGQAQGELETGRGQLALTLTRDQFAIAATAVLKPLGATLQALSAAGDDATLVVPASLLEVPGIDETLAAARFARVMRIADGIAAVPASLLPGAAPATATTGGVPYLTRITHLPQSAPSDVLQPHVPQGVEPEVMATHVVFRGRAVPITAQGLVIGRDPGEGAVLRLPDGMAGLSRRHCTLRREGARTHLVDHSRHGTYLDGLRVRGRALLAAGSTLKLGEPGIELPLVALAGAAE